MTLIVTFDLSYEFAVNAGADEVFELLADVPASARHFPQVAQLVDLGGQAWRWEMEAVGPAQMALQTIYAARYVADKKQGSVTWTPVKDVGNAQIGGAWTVTDKVGFTALRLDVCGEFQLPLPGLMKGLVAPVVERENEKLLTQYIANLVEHFGGEPL